MGGYVKRWKFVGTKSVLQAANGPVWLPQGQKPLCLIHFWGVPFSNFQPLLPRSFLSPQYKEMVHYGRLSKNVEILCDKISLTGYKWSSSNAPRSYIFDVIHLWGQLYGVPFHSSCFPQCKISPVICASSGRSDNWDWTREPRCEY